MCSIGASSGPRTTTSPWSTATKILPRMAQQVLASSGARELSVLGYCMGAPISASFVATHAEIPVKNYIDMAGPIDFSKVGLFGLRSEERRVGKECRSRWWRDPLKK